jgi:hypothetical protein
VRYSATLWSGESAQFIEGDMEEANIANWLFVFIFWQAMRILM